MIEPRIYRAAFVPAILAVVLTMFSLGSRPRPLPQGLAADVLFDGRLARQTAIDLVELAPDRRAGGVGDRAVAGVVAERLKRRGFAVEVDRFEHADRSLANVVARRAGSSRRQIVVLAARDAFRTPDADGSASDTAALLELGRVFEGRPSRRTLVLASVDGSTLGDVGTTRLLDSLGEPGLVDAVLVMSDLGARSRGGPLVQAWSNDSRRAGIGLQRTAADSIRRELDLPVGGTGALGQLARLSFPIGIGDQGVLLERGFEAVRISGSGALPPDGPGQGQDIDEDRLGGLGRATLRTLTALDQARTPPQHGPRSYVTLAGQVLPGWVLQLLAGALLLPVLAASLDAFARARRRQLAVTPWLRWVAAWVAPFVAGLALAELLAAVGATPVPPAAPVPPAVDPVDGAALAVLAGVGVAMALAWLAARRLALWPDQTLRAPDAPGAAVALMLVVSAAALALWLLNPYTALLAVPAAHLWLLACLTDPPPPRRWRLALAAAGGLPLLLVAIYYLFALDLDPLGGAWYLLLLVTGHHVSLAGSLLASTLLGAGLAALQIARQAQPEPEPPDAQERPRVYGPGGLAGPGSLGGTRSALRR
ncbi:MAG TPA: hypothetical protein VI111_09945 [Thermoleophilaceae bacterium]